jgi:cell division protein FtsI (penicillin-binding protein 3)
VQLTLDSVLQHYAERELAKLMDEYQPESCCALVMDPRTGELLAMASAPTLDPNHPEQADPDAWKNRAIADIYEPGSTFKPMIVAYGVDQKRLSLDDSFYCERGVYRMGRRILHDHHGYGTLNLTDVLVKSSNIGMAKIGERLTNDGLHAAATAFGFGRPTGIELPGELGGILRPREQWTSYSTGSIPMGHEIATTPLQLLRAHAVLANGGRLVTPHILQTGVIAAESVPRVIAEETATWIVREPMRQTVVRGTGKKAQIAGYSVFGKTGTAQSLSPQGGYRHGKYIASFVCGAPAERPEVVVLVVVNQATTGGEAFGGRVAAPAAAEILKHALSLRSVPPDVTADGPQRGVRR